MCACVRACVCVCVRVCVCVCARTLARSRSRVCARARACVIARALREPPYPLLGLLVAPLVGRGLVGLEAWAAVVGGAGGSASDARPVLLGALDQWKNSFFIMQDR